MASEGASTGGDRWCVRFSFPERHKGHIMKPAPCVPREEDSRHA